MEWQLDWFQKYFSPACIKGLLNTLCCNIQILTQAINSQAWALKHWVSTWWEGSEGQWGSQRWALRNHRGEKCSKDSGLRNCSSQCLTRNQRMPKTEMGTWLSKTTSCGTLKHFGLILPYSFSRRSWKQRWACFYSMKLSPASQVMLRCILGPFFTATGFGPRWCAWLKQITEQLQNYSSSNCPGNTRRTSQEHPEDNTTAPGWKTFFSEHHFFMFALGLEV